MTVILAIALSLAANPATVAPPPVVSITGQSIYLDKAQNIEIQFAELPFDTLLFSSHLPEGWTFGIDVDGDQNGVWGAGHGMPDNSLVTSLDRSFGQGSKNGAFCSQYIFTTLAQDPSEIYAKSDCGDPASNGRAVLGGYDSSKRATVTLEIPANELFGTRLNAHVQICVWNTIRWTCQHRMPDLLVLRRTTPARSK